MNDAKIIHISYTNIFQFKGVTFEWHRFCGPTIINRHTEEERQYKNISLRVWALVSKFSWLTDEQKEEFRIF